MEEIWKDVKGYEGDYMVSNHGRVCLTISSRAILHILKLGLNTRKYYRVTLRKHGVNKTVSVSRLVAIAFIKNPENKPQVNHINGVKTDNRVENLEWCTGSENMKHAFISGLHDGVRGSKNNLSKLTEIEVVQIRKIYNSGFYKQKEVGEFFNVKASTIKGIVNRRRWAHIA